MFTRWFQTPDEKLIEAIKAKNEAEAQKLIVKMDITELNKIDTDGNTALIWATNQIDNYSDSYYTRTTNRGLEKIWELLIPKMSEQTINQISNNGYTALTLAANRGLDKVCELLIPKMSEQTINAISKDGYTALIGAAYQRLKKVCEMLIPKMSEQAINQIDKDGYTALTWAADRLLSIVCKMLISIMTEQAINHVNKEGKTAYKIADHIFSANNNETARNICNLFTNKDICSLRMEKLIIAIKAKNTIDAEKLILVMHQSELSKINYDTVLYKAAWQGLDKVCELLIPKMTEQAINHVGTSNNTALIGAANNRLEKVCELLIPRMTDQAINQVNNYGETALKIATFKGLKNICNLLTNKKNINTVSSNIISSSSIIKKDEQKVIEKSVLNINNNTITWEKLMTAIRAKDTLEAEKLILSINQNELNKVNSYNRTALIEAAWQSLGRICELLISRMTDQAISQVDKGGSTALIGAANNRLEKICELLIPRMTNQAINSSTDFTGTTLNIAAFSGLEKICEMLIPRMNNQAINHVNKYGETALILAANNSMEKVCELLIPRMNDQAINQVTNYGNTALKIATLKGFKNICNLLTNKKSINTVSSNIISSTPIIKKDEQKVIEKSALNINTMSNNITWEKLMTAIKEKNIVDIQNLIECVNQSELSRIDNSDNTVLILAACQGLEQVCEMLIARMTNQAINHVNWYGDTALTLAASSGLERICKLLIPKMTNKVINQVTKHGDTALIWAINSRLDKICEMIIPKMSNDAISQINNNGETALSLATKNGFKNICDLLTNKKDNLVNKSDIKEKQEEQHKGLKFDESKYNQLILAIKEGKIEDAKNLAQHLNTATLNKVNDNGNTVLTLAASKGLGEVCTQLILKMTKGAINHVDDEGNTALTLAAWKGLGEVCVQLIPKMTNQTINYINNYGNTALTLAASKGLEQVCDLLTLRINEQNNQINKAKAEKKQEEQQQSLKLKQAASITNENKPADIRDLFKEVPKQNIIPISPVVQEKDIYEVLAAMIDKLENTPTINEKDKDKLQNNIMSKIEKLGDNKADLQKIAKSIQGIINNNKFTKGMLVDLEEEINEVIQEKAKIANQARIDKLNIFKQTIAKVLTNLEKDTGIAVNNKAEMKNTINKVISDVSRLTNISDIEKITASIKELTTGKITKGKLVDVEEELNEIILEQLNKNVVVTWAVTEIIYDNPLLNHPKLLQAAVDSKISSDLIQEAINNNDEELILAGLISVGYDVTQIN